MKKKELRKIYLEKRKSLSPEERSEKSRKICENFFQNYDLSRIDFLHCYLSIEKFGEIDTKQIFERIWREFPRAQTLVPRINTETDELESLKFTSQTGLKKNFWQIPEPAHDEIVDAEKIDLVLVPLLAFDKNGYRVGYGKGYYDKFLKNCRPDCLKIGLSFFPPIEKIKDAQDYDVPVDFCITPEAIYRAQGILGMMN